MTDLIEALAGHFRGREVYVSGNLLLYYERMSCRRLGHLVSGQALLRL